MQNLARNERLFWYCLYAGKTPLVDENGFETSEYLVSYDTPVKTFANISAATGSSQVETFGTLDNYDKVISTADMTCPIDENSVLFIDKDPEFTEDGTPIYDYVVRRVAKSLNNISIAIRKVDVS